ncbi:sensor domain-containing diguanylate cyclase [Wenzhouxiangella sp. EGI_FJ10305]|uniref:sensor domain-containing diguanylate cyclase n=1 Tax=Wenzhouxiangella sp. EGI_FJ10305 TaxID=3243768 RepID=UPI0035DD692E
MVKKNQPSGDGFHSAVRLVGLALAWILLWRASALMEYAPHASIWFPPAGLTLAAFLTMGWRAAWAIVPAAILVTFWTAALYDLEQTTPHTLLAGVLFALAHGGSYALGAAVLRWLGRREPALSLPALVITFLVIASASALLASKLGIESLILGGSLKRADSAGLWLPWWIGDMAAAVTLAPLFAGLLGQAKRPGTSRFPIIRLTGSENARAPWFLKLTTLLTLLAIIMALTALFGRGELLAFAAFFLIIPQMWITYTESAFRVAVSLAAFSILIAVSVGALGLEEHAMVYQFAITVIAASTWFGLTVPTLVEQNRHLREIAEADELTGVTSRRHFFERAREELDSLQGKASSCSLVIFDVDRFKQINDIHGHFAGDAALQEIATTVSGRLRREDLFGRFGGDEFMVLMGNCPGPRAAERAEELRLAIHEIRLPNLDAALSGTFSVVEVMPDESITHAFDRADALLLHAKRSGRDRVVRGDRANGRHHRFPTSPIMQP